MTNITERGVYVGEVISVQHAYKKKGTKNLHLITFKMDDGTRYVAEESEDNARSNFIINTKNTFSVTHPGEGGRLDWIRWISVEGGQPPANGSVAGYSVSAITRDNLMVAQVAMTCATNLGIKNDWTLDQIVNKALMLAGNIKIIAKEIGEELL